MHKITKKSVLLTLAAFLTIGIPVTADEYSAYYDDWIYEEDSFHEDWYIETNYDFENSSDDYYAEDSISGQWYYVSTDYDPGIVLHPIPEKDSETLIRIPYLHTFFVEKVDGNYGYTYYGGYEGWINIGEHAQPITSPSELSDCYIENEWYQISTKYNPGIALHPAPEKDSETLVRVPYTTLIYVEYICGKYGYTNYEGFQGWINVGEHAELIETVDPNSVFPQKYRDENIIPDSSQRYLSYDEISYLTAQELCYARNEIYARHGRKFNSAELQSYFNSTSWYEGIYSPDSFNEASLNAYEKENVLLLLKREKELCPEGYLKQGQSQSSSGSSTNYSASEVSQALNEYCKRYYSSEYTSYVSDEYQEGNNYVLWYRWYTGFNGKYTADLVSGEMYESGPYVGREPDETLPFSTEYIGNIDDYL